MTPSILLVGLDFHTAPIDLREHVALAGDDLAGALCSLHAVAAEAVIVSTCNRLEFYLVTKCAEQGQDAIEVQLTARSGMDASTFRPHIYVKHDGEAMRHLLAVASGLESMILGEPQILGQIGRAYIDAHDAQTTGPVLSRLFHQAQHCGKRARTETGIGSQVVSLSHAAADLVSEWLVATPSRIPNPRRCGSAQVLIVGAGEMARLAAQALRCHDATSLVFVNRTLSHAEALAKGYGGEAYAWKALPALLQEVDAVICATGAPGLVVTREAVAVALPCRTGRPLLLVDLALPRDIEPAVGELPGVVLHDLDGLNEQVEAARNEREAARPQVEAIIDEELAALSHRLQEVGAVPVITALRARARQAAEAETRRTLDKLGTDDPRVAREIEYLTHRLINKLLHEPTVKLKQRTVEGARYDELVRDLFCLDEGCRSSED